MNEFTLHYSSTE